MFSLAVMIAFVAVGFSVEIIALWAVARWERLPRASLLRAAAVIVIWGVLNILTAMNPVTNSAMRGTAALILLAAPFVLIRVIMRASVKAAFVTYVAVALSSGLAIALGLGIVRPFLLEAFSVPTNAMAPTVFGPHEIAVCPRCGGRLIVDAPDPLDRGSDTHQDGICVDCGKTSPYSVVGAPEQPSDRILVNKLLTPRRWDILAYHFGESIYLKRIVALPGERLRIDPTGAILINGAAVAPPAEVPNGRFRWPEFFDARPQVPLHPDQEITLASDEYFVVGDNAGRSSDSRFTGPVKRSAVVGVADFIYSPLSRMRVLR